MKRQQAERRGLWGQVFGIVRITARGEKLYAFLNAMQAAQIRCYGQQCQNAELHGVIYGKDCKKMRQLAEQYHITVQETPRKTLYEQLHRYRFRFGIPIGALLGAAFLIYCCNVVMIIEVQGNQTVSDEKIYAVLKECGVQTGTFMGSISFAFCEHQLRANISELCRVSMRHTGNRIVVEVTETPEEVEKVQKRIPCNIVAAYDAEITAITVQSGQLLCQVGDAVRKGTMLVNGVQADGTGEIHLYHAMADITGIYTIKETFSCPYTQTIRTNSGQEQTHSYLDFFTLQIPLSQSITPYAVYHLSTERTPLTLFGATLPIAVCREIYTEYTETSLQFTLEEAKQDLEQQNQRYILNFLQDKEILDQTVTYTEKETALECTVSYTLKGEIGVQQELFLQD